MKRICAFLLIGLTSSGCAIMVPGHLYPIRGPLSADNPTPVFDVSFSGVLNSGTMRATLRNGEVCRGSWTTVPQNDPTASGLSADWDSVYGPGFFVANVLGNRAFARAALSGNAGTTVDVELYEPRPGDISRLVGVARDNRGNVFKLTF